MTRSFGSLFSAVHPHQIEVQEFDSYALIVDVRDAASYTLDHLPRAVSLPRPAAAGIDASAWPGWLHARIAGLDADDRILVCCDRGGLDADALAKALRALGKDVDVLPGGWGNYRRWVAAALEVLPRGLTLRPLVAPPVSGLCRILDVLREQGEQVLDLADLCGQRVLPGLSLPGDEPPSQPTLETRIVDAMRRFDPQRVVWVRAGVSLPQRLAWPPALREALQRSRAIRVEVPCDERARRWCERMRSVQQSAAQVLSALRHDASGGCERGFERWQATLGEREVETMMQVISECIDARFTPENAAGRTWHLHSLAHDEVARELRSLVAVD